MIMIDIAPFQGVDQWRVLPTACPPRLADELIRAGGKMKRTTGRSATAFWLNIVDIGLDSRTVKLSRLAVVPWKCSIMPTESRQMHLSHVLAVKKNPVVFVALAFLTTRAIPVRRCPSCARSFDQPAGHQGFSSRRSFQIPVRMPQPCPGQIVNTSGLIRR